MINIKKFDSVAEAVKGVMQKEALKGQQHQIDKNKNNKIDAHDFAILRGEKKHMKKEETEQVNEISLDTMKSAKEKLANKAHDAHMDDNKYAARLYALRALKMKSKIKNKERQATQEEVEQVDEVNNPFDLKNYKSQLKSKPGEKAGFDSKKISTGTFYSRKPVKDEPMKKEEVEQVDERTLTKGETAEKERIVKGMKKNLKGFKQRYGEKAKSVMYATATKAAKNEETIVEAKRPESDTVPFITNGDNKPLEYAKELASKSLKRLKSEMMGKTGTSE